MGLINGATGFVLGFAAGFGTGYVARDHAPRLKDIASPAMKFVLKSSLVMAERSKEGFAKFGETVQDLLAEAQTELKERMNGAARPRKKFKKSASIRVRKKKVGKVAEHGREAEVIPLGGRRTVT